MYSMKPVEPRERIGHNILLSSVCGLAVLMAWSIPGEKVFSYNWTRLKSHALSERSHVSMVAFQRATGPSPAGKTGYLNSFYGCLGSLIAAACIKNSTSRARATWTALKADEDTSMSRRLVVLPMILASSVPANAEEVALPTKITADPYELLSIDPTSKAQDKKEFDMHKNYRQDTYQVVKHMKISGSIDKGAPNMEKWNKRVKEEMNDWVALYRRQDAVVGRQSYYALYSAVNTLASHFTSYGPKFPFPNKRRARFYELINQTERYLEKNK